MERKKKRTQLQLTQRKGKGGVRIDLKPEKTGLRQGKIKARRPLRSTAPEKASSGRNKLSVGPGDE